MRQIRRLLSVIFILIGMITVVPIFSGIASAHHSAITASVACNGTVSWTATSWSTNGSEGTNPDIHVSLTVGSTTTLIAEGAFNAPNYKFSGTFMWPTGATSITVSSKPNHDWGNGNTSRDGGTTTINKPTNCPGQPGVSNVVSCANTSPGHGNGTVTLTLSNTGVGPFASSVTFEVYSPDQTVNHTPYPVASGQTTPVTFSGLADGTHSVKVTAVGFPDMTQTFTVDCDSPLPAVTIVQTCADGDGRVVVTLSNTGGEAVVFDVTDPKTKEVEHVTVNADSSTTRTFSGLADGNYTLVIKVGGIDYSKPFTIDCKHPLPRVSSSVVCDSTHDGSVTITLANDGTEGVVFHVTNPFTHAVEDVTVAAGASTTRTFGGFSDGTHTVTITAAGFTGLSQTFTVTCDLAPSYSFTQSCVDGDGSVAVTMTNNGDDLNAVFVLAGTSYTLLPGATKVVTLSGLSDGTRQIALTVNGADKSFPITVACDRPGQPSAAIAQSCANEDGVVVVTLKNLGGQLPLTFTVAGTDYVVPADSTLPVTIAGLIDGTHVIAIHQGELDLSQTVTIHCDQAPTVTFTQACVEGANGTADGQVIVTLHNNGDDVAVTFTVNDTPYTVAPKASQVVTISGLSDGTHHIAVLAGAIDLGFDVTVACDHPGEPAVEVVQSCADEDGVVVVTLRNIGGELPLSFTVEGVEYVVPAGSNVPVTISGLVDGSHVIAIHQGELDLSQTVTVACDQAPTVTFTQACVEGANGTADGQVIVTLHNNGDDVAVTFTVNDTPYTVAPKASQVVTISGLSDGTHHIAVLAGAVDLSFDVTVACDRPGEASVSSAVACENADGVVTVSLGATGGEKPVTFTVRGVEYIVQPDTVQTVVISGLADRTNRISVFQGERDLSFDVYSVCDVQVSPPDPFIIADPAVVLPATGAANLADTLAVGFGALLLGGALLLYKRRLGTR